MIDRTNQAADMANKKGISFIVNAHREGGLLIAALRSVQHAMECCEAHGIPTQAILIVDKPDSATRRIAESWRSYLAHVEFVEFGNLGSARAHGFALAEHEFYCFLDGDDIWQADWPVKAYQFAIESDYLNTVFHTELFVSFGDSLEVRKQIQTSDSIFHPAHLAVCWHFCNNLFAHRSIFERVPLEPYDHSKGYGSEDWHWSCQTLAEGIERRYVPETLYFYRIDNRKQSLGKTAGLVLRKSRLFSEALSVAAYPLGDADSLPKEEANFAVDHYDLAEQTLIGDWVPDEIGRAAKLDFGLFHLKEHLPNLKARTQRLYPISASLFSCIRRFFDKNGEFGVIMLDEYALTREERTRLHFSLRRKATLSGPLVILSSGELTDGGGYRVFGNVLVVNIYTFWRESGGNKFALNQTLSTAFANFTPKYILNFNHWYGRTLVEDYRVFLSAAQVPCLNYLERPVFDSKNTEIRSVLSGTIAGLNSYSTYVCPDALDVQYIKSLSPFFGNVNVVQKRLDVADLAATLASLASVVEEHSSLAHRDWTASSAPESSLQVPKKPSAKVSHREESVEVSVILNAHREGRLLTATMNSISRMLDFGTERGLSCEVICVLDHADEETMSILEGFAEALEVPSQLLAVTHKNLGLARNSGIRASKGKFICFLDADDLYSENWLVEAYSMARARNGRAVVHPEVNIYFGRETRVFRHFNSRDIDASGLLMENFWTSLSFAPRSIFDATEYQPLDIENGFGFEDWHWNMEVLQKGYEHVYAPQTAHFIRLKSAGSLNQISAQNKVLCRPAKLFGHLLQPDSKIVCAASS